MYMSLCTDMYVLSGDLETWSLDTNMNLSLHFRELLQLSPTASAVYNSTILDSLFPS